MLERLLRLVSKDKKAYNPTAPILFTYKLIEILERLLIFLRGDKRYYAPRSPI